MSCVMHTLRTGGDDAYDSFQLLGWVSLPIFPLESFARHHSHDLSAGKVFNSLVVVRTDARSRVVDELTTDDSDNLVAVT